MKKLFTLFVLFALCLGAKADTIEDAFVDYSTWSGWDLYSMGYEPIIQDGHLYSFNPEDEETGDPKWYQYFMCPAIEGLQKGMTYQATFAVQGEKEGEVNIDFRWSWDDPAISVTLPVTTEMEEHTITIPSYGGDRMDIIFQSAAYVGEIEFASIRLTHEGKAQKPVVWNNCLENGDAEGEYAEVACAWGKEAKGDPHPADIETVDGSKVFVVHATAKESDPWDNQFWIMAPKSFASGETFTLSFRYKATKATGDIATQQHKEAGNYLHWSGVGAIKFTTDWQTFTKDVTVPGEANGMMSFAFNLNDFEEANDYYFDDLNWGTMSDLEEGLFIAGDFNDWDFDGSLDFEWNEGDEWGGWYQVTVGTAEKPASEIKISTQRGNSIVYNQNVIKFNSADINDATKPWHVYGAGDEIIKLPVPGIWTVCLDKASGKMRFICADFTPTGGPAERPEPALGEWYNTITNGDASVDFDPEIAYNDDEKNYTVCAWTKNDGQAPVPAPTVVIDRDGNKAFVSHATDCISFDIDEETGEKTYRDESAWDNQFWIQAPMEFTEGDEIIVKFRYKCNKARVRTNTQAHLQQPSNYKHWDMVGDVTFTDEWQSFEKKVTVNADQSGIWSVAFNLSPDEKTATDFYFTDLAIETVKLDKGYFVSGDFNNDDKTAAKHMLWNEAKNYYEVCVGTEDAPASYVKLSTRRGTDAAYEKNRLWLEVEELTINGCGPDNFYALTKTLPDLGDDATDEQKEAIKTITLPEPGVWTLLLSEEDVNYIAFVKGDITEVEDGINAAVANDKVIYYNLNGMRIDAPTKGIFIKKQGTKATKVLF